MSAAQAVIPNKQDKQLNSKGHNWGGVRANQGRKHGSVSKYSPRSLLATIDAKLQADRGLTFAESLAEGYVDSINSGDTKLRYLYEKAILDKVIADKIEVSTDSEGTLEAKMEAFHRALNNNTTVALTVQPSVQHSPPPSDG